MATVLGGGTVADLAISSVIKISSTYHFYGYAEFNSMYRLLQASRSSWNSLAA